MTEVCNVLYKWQRKEWLSKWQRKEWLCYRNGKENNYCTIELAKKRMVIEVAKKKNPETKIFLYR